MASITYIEQTDRNNGRSLKDSEDYQIAQTFTSDIDFTLAQVQLKLQKMGTPAYDQTLKIYITDAGHEPTGGILATATLAKEDIPLAYDWVDFDLITPLDITGGTEYIIIFDSGSGGIVTDYVLYGYQSTDVYVDGYMLDKSPAWIHRTTWDMTFRLNGAPISAPPLTEAYVTKQLIAISSDEVWYESPAGTMNRFAASAGQLDTTDFLNITEAFQKLFIVNGTIKKVLDFVNTKIIAVDIDNPGKPPDFGTILTGQTSGAKMIVDYITGIAGEKSIYGKRTTVATFQANEVVKGTNPTTSPYAGAVEFTMTATDEVVPPHWYDYTVFGADADNYGIIPDRVYQICKYRGRIQLSGDPNYPHQWYQSSQLNPFDFLYVAGDAQSPVAGNNADCAEVGDIIKVAIPYSDDYLIYGCANELWVMSGDAAFGGELNPIDTTTGILGDRAWCWDDKSNLYIMGTAGLLRIPKGFGQIENLTRELWPDFIEDLALDSSLHRIVLAFDPEKVGIHIFKTTLATGACVGWWYDLRVGGLFPDAIPTTMGIYSAFYYQTENPSYRKLLVGCADGYIKSFDKTTKNDDGTKITSYVGFAPLALSTHPRKDGIIKNIDVVTGIGDIDSNNVVCTVHTARTAGQIIKKLNDGDAASFTKTFIAPNWTKSNLDRRSVRGQWGAIVLTNSALAESWSMERLIVDSKEIGRSL